MPARRNYGRRIHATNKPVPDSSGSSAFRMLDLIDDSPSPGKRFLELNELLHDGYIASCSSSPSSSDTNSDLSPISAPSSVSSPSSTSSSSDDDIDLPFCSPFNDRARANFPEQDLELDAFSYAVLTGAPHTEQGTVDPQLIHSSGSPASTPPNNALQLDLCPSDDDGDRLRELLGIPSDKPLNLWSIPDPPEGEKLETSLPILIELAIRGTTLRSEKKLTSHEIRDALVERFDYFRRRREAQDTKWESSVRHTLSLKTKFIKVASRLGERQRGHGGFWKVDATAYSPFGPNKRERQRKTARKAASGSC
ncbi:hypothetical protein R3P38DRAFT_2906711 [Favolaschia claudopus]|uniref:Fork-head domain-containing protein n=1 Tax=Favolaschia claudopus TaxID=2862362 RepID=A0AAW0CLU3_9AGAR